MVLCCCFALTAVCVCVCVCVCVLCIGLCFCGGGVNHLMCISSISICCFDGEELFFFSSSFVRGVSNHKQ